MGGVGMGIALYRPAMSHVSRPRRRESGYSMIELLVVMAILAMMALVVGPWFFKISQRNIVKSAAREVATSLAAARMRAVKRNLPAQVIITPASGAQPSAVIETFEMIQPTPLKVGEAHISNVEFPPSGTYYPQPTGMLIRFGPDGRATTAATFTLRGPVGAGVPNDLPVSTSANGRIAVLGPNPTVAKPMGTEWH